MLALKNRTLDETLNWSDMHKPTEFVNDTLKQEKTNLFIFYRIYLV